jgi:single-strand DNA-binding protein
MGNLVVLLGRLARPAEARALPSGDQLVSFELSVRHPEGRAEPVPVAWFDPPPWAATLAVDEEVLVVGRVRRRFFRAGGATQSRTEVVAEAAVPARQGRRVAALLALAAAVLAGLGDEAGPALARRR